MKTDMERREQLGQEVFMSFFYCMKMPFVHMREASFRIGEVLMMYFRS